MKPFTKVLVRNTLLSTWKASFYDHYSRNDSQPYVTINNVHWRYCIPFEGNEHLHNKTDMPDNKK